MERWLQHAVRLLKAHNAIVAEGAATLEALILAERERDTANLHRLNKHRFNYVNGTTNAPLVPQSHCL